MQHVIRIRALEAEAKRLNLSLLVLCRRAKVQYSTVRRWEKQEVSPRLDNYEHVTAALDAALSRAKADMRKALEAAQ